jgi:hypothetical protein
MAIQRYFQGPSRYHRASDTWLALPSPENGLDNFGYLMATLHTLEWNTADGQLFGGPNQSASYTRNNGPEGLLALGPYNGPIPGVGNVQIPEGCFFYEDAPEMPEHLIDTPFLLRGLATALRDRLPALQSVSKPFVFWVRYDGAPNRPGVLSIRRHQW